MTKPVDRPISLDTGLLLIRLMMAAVFLFHGSQKLFAAFDGPGIEGFARSLNGSGVPVPMLAAIVSASAEFIGGLVLLLGNGTRFAALVLFINMLVAVALVHRHAFALSAQPPGMEYALTLAIVSLALVFTGSGRFTALEMFGRRA